MFTGIVEPATVRSIRPTGQGHRLTLALPSARWRPTVGESLAVNGACLTVTGRRGPLVRCDVIPETWRRTNFARLRPGSRVHVERPMQFADRVHGHFVQGHVDGTGTVLGRGRRGEEVWLSIRVPAAMRRWLLPKGSLAVDGVSLTIVAVQGGTVRVDLIPHTLRHSTLGQRRPGELVNLEGDYLLKWASLWMLPHRKGVVSRR
ncbi:MAG: riboflavin synthase [Candidatus Omnitrophica bacterium]|nr:riboflavin synthase [Candidatus Omnitrophota bacterium]